MLDANHFGDTFDKRIYVSVHVFILFALFISLLSIFSLSLSCCSVALARHLSTAAEQFAIQTSFKLYYSFFFVFLSLYTWHGYQIITKN